MLNSIYTFSSPLIPVVQEKVGDALSDVQKRTLIVALAAIVLLVSTIFILYLELRTPDDKIARLEEIRKKTDVLIAMDEERKKDN